MVVEWGLVVAGQLFLVFIDAFLYGEMYENFNQKGTKIKQVKALHKNVIEAIVITGCARRAYIVIIPIITLIQTDNSFEFKIIQFPLEICFAINKSKGQSLSMAGIGLREEYFSRGQFYVAHFRVSSASSLVILAQKGNTKK
ncbi:ATP-dependent DNA helicase PIF1-like [Aphis craccivora]|uniref:ATP-dependent DNA helicase PIF1-like n=1 Tax=Aphis craccivora TaxID=307492 RepID=A0A6G0Z5S7_APHCR|nr:ATP-dependent DNA helicase PIF1-like [Aphis craccivora]